MLSDRKAHGAKAREAAYKLTDSGGLYLNVTPAGSKVWRLRYRVGKLEKLLTLGRYPDLGLADARAQAETARAGLRAGIDPALTKRLKRAQGEVAARDTFEAVAREWHAVQAPGWTVRHAADVLDSLAPIFREIGGVRLTDITPPLTLSVLRPIEGRGAIETARRVRQRMSAVFVFAISSGRAEQDPAAIVKGALAPMVKGRQPAVVDLAEARIMLARAEAEPAHAATRLAFRFQALTAVRPGETRGATWSQIEDLDGNEPLWRVPAELMKMHREHLVPLSTQAVDVLRAMQPLRPQRRDVLRGGGLIFPSSRHAHKPLSENALGYLLHRAGYHGRHVPHGWRATFSTVMNERYPGDRGIIDMMLAHQPKNVVEAAYNRAMHLARRRELAQIWADLLLVGAGPAKLLRAGPHRSSSKPDHGAWSAVRNDR